MSNVTGTVMSGFYPLVANDKGDISNRLKCTKEQMTNRAKTFLQLGLVSAGSSAASYGVFKSSIASKAIAKVVDKALGILPKTTVVQKILNASPMTKALGVVGAISMSLLAHIITKSVYKAGQIDQKYTDRAKMEAKTKDVFDA
ncbi:hypothetical protein IJ596_01930 [bacterium]|nr:hypothetical protein [bacterium]